MMKGLGWLILLIFFLPGCATQPTVYLYGKYLSEGEKAAVIQQLLSKEYQVKLNDFDFPTSINQNTIIYSLLLNDPSMINQVEQIAAEAGMSIDRTQAMTAGNHWYTKDSLAMFLLPDNPAGAPDIFRQDLIQNFTGENCGGLSVRLFENGDYEFTGKKTSSLRTGPLNGTWKYRQYPYLELKKQGSQYADHYFEISRFTDRDKVSEIAFIKLSPMNADDFAKNCVFLYGIRQ